MIKKSTINQTNKTRIKPFLIKIVGINTRYESQIYITTEQLTEETENYYKSARKNRYIQAGQFYIKPTRPIDTNKYRYTVSIVKLN